MQSNNRGLRVGDRIECWSQEEGFLDCFFEAELQSTKGGRCVVKYLEEEGGKLIEEIPLEQVRPVPPRVDPPGQNLNFSSGHSVEAYYQDGWWKGAVHKKVDQEYYICYFLSNGLEQLRLHYSQLRTPQEWINGEWVLKGPLAWRSKDSFESPQHHMRLRLPSPQTPQSPSPACQPAHRASSGSLSEDFILEEDEEDVNIEDCPIVAKTAAARPPSEEKTVSEPLASPSSGDTSEKRQRLEEGRGNSGQTRGQNMDYAPQRTGKKDKRKRPAVETISSDKKRRRVCSSENERSGWGTSISSQSLSARNATSGEPAAHSLAFVDASSPSRNNALGTSQQVPSSSPFGKNTVMRWAGKQCRMDDVMRRSAGDLMHLGLSPYDLECQINRERQEACRGRKEESSSYDSLPSESQAAEAWTQMRSQDPAVARSQSALPSEDCYQEEGGDFCEDAWQAPNEERPCASIEPPEHRAAECPQQNVVRDRFSFKAAYAGILEALLRKNMPDYRREYLLAELRTDLNVSEQYHLKHRQRVLQNLGCFAS